MATVSRPLLLSDLLRATTWAILIFSLGLMVTYLAGCYVLEVSTELVDNGKNERKNRTLFFRKGPMEFIIGSYQNGHPVLDSMYTRAASASGVDL